MKNLIRMTWNRYVPYKFRECLSIGKRLKLRQIDFDKKILQIEENYGDCQDVEIQQCISFMRQHKKINVFNGAFTTKYDKVDIDVNRDKDGFPYVLWEGKELYFPQSFSDAETRDYTRRLMIEQDIDSPHCYLDDICNVNKEDIVFDCGGAEGNFALSIIDKIKYVVIFECEEQWIRALEKTFEKYKDKVTIAKHFVCGKTEGDYISLDEYAERNNIWPTFVKMDIEGAEIDALQGMRKIIHNQNNLKCSICTYHRKNDLEEIKDLLKENFTWKISNGYMLLENEQGIYFARGLIRCMKKMM